MANLQIKNIDESFYNQIKDLAAAENRSVSQQIIFLTRQYLASAKDRQQVKTSAEVLLELCGSWDSDLSAEEMIDEIKSARINSDRLKDGF